MSQEYKTLKIKVIAVKNKEKPLLILLMTIKLIVTLIQFRVLCTWEKGERGFNRIWQGENNAYYRSICPPLSLQAQMNGKCNQTYIKNKFLVILFSSLNFFPAF